MKNTISVSLKKFLTRINPMSLAALLSFVLLSLTLSVAATPLPGEKELYGEIIRFHVLANSDSEEDQNLKLAVRDKVTEYTTTLLEGCCSIAEAKEIISQNSDKIVEISKKVIKDKNKEYPVCLKQGLETYPKRIYGNYTFPAGEYYSVRLEIGDACGKNWWCVLFPPMCLGGATAEKYDDTSALSKIGFTDNAVTLISDEKTVKREIRFFFLDLVNFRK